MVAIAGFGIGIASSPRIDPATTTAASPSERRPVVPRIDTEQPLETPSRTSLFFSPTTTTRPPSSTTSHARTPSGSSNTFAASGSSLSLASLDSTGAPVLHIDDNAAASTSTLPRGAASFEYSLATPTCQLSSASSIRSRRNWEEFEGKPVSPLPSPAALSSDDYSASSMFDRHPSPSRGHGGGSSGGSGGGARPSGSNVGAASASGSRATTRAHGSTPNGGSTSSAGSEPETPSKTSAFFGASWASYPRAPSTLLPPPPPRRDRVASSSDATDAHANDAAAASSGSGGGWSTLQPSTRAVSLEQGLISKRATASSDSAQHDVRGAGSSSISSGSSAYSSHSRLDSGPRSAWPDGYTESGQATATSSTISPPSSSSPPYTSSAVPLSASSANGSSRSAPRYDGLPTSASGSSFSFRSVRDRLDEQRVEPVHSPRRIWRELEGGAGSSTSSSSIGSSIDALAVDELAPLSPTGTSSRRQGRLTRHFQGPSEIASGSSLSPVVDSVSQLSSSYGSASTPRAEAVQSRPSASSSSSSSSAARRPEDKLRPAEGVAEEDEDGDMIGPYRRERVLGVGAFSQVALGRAVRPPRAQTGAAAAAPSDDALVALKMLDREPCRQNERLKVSWVREVEVLKHISHPNLVRFVSAFSTPLHHTLVLEHVSGGELFELLAQHHDGIAQREWLVRRIFAELAGAIGWMHHVNLVHRDIKLENILMTTPHLFSPGLGPLTPSRLPRGPVVKLTDFGLSRFIDPQEPLLETRCGSEEYAAPELIIGKRYDGRKTDAWALGVVLYALLTGSLPFLEDVGGGSGSGSYTATAEGGQQGIGASREGASGERDAKQRKAHLLRIAKGDLRWPSRLNDPPSDVPDPSTCPASLRLVTPSAKLLAARLLRRDATKRAAVWETWDAEWLVRGSFPRGEASAGGEEVAIPPDPRGVEGSRWLADRARVRGGEVSQLACDD